MKISQPVAICLSLLIMFSSAIGAGQDKASTIADAPEIALARSAAPKLISDAASIYVYRDGMYKLAITGTNGFTCLVLRDEDPRSRYPACLDAEWTRCELPEYMKEAELRKQGMSPDDIDTTLNRMRRASRFPNPTRSGIAYMASSEMRGMFTMSTAGRIQPHVMIYAPGATNAQIGVSSVSTARVLHVPFVANEGMPNAHILSPLMTYSDGSRFKEESKESAPSKSVH